VEQITLMKNKILILSGLLFGLAIPALGATFTFTPTPANLGNLDHHQATTWGMSWAVPQGQTITGAQLKISNIYDWRVENNDALFIHLLNNPASGVTFFADNTNDNVVSDFFADQGVLLDVWSDPFGGSARNFDYVFNFTPDQLVTLANYLNDGGNFGLGFDPDCHYYNSGASFVITTSGIPVTNTNVPDAGGSVMLFGLGLGGLAYFRRKFAA
jgi:VPDSG-CTERM motif